MNDDIRFPPPPARPWWRFGFVWFVFSGPAIVVVAGFVTMAIAYHGADVPLHDSPSINTPVAGPAPARP